jgi:CRP-like cAMP-binding protein
MMLGSRKFGARKKKRGLGKVYDDGEVVIREGEIGDCMYVVQAGEVAVLRGSDGEEHELARLQAGDFFGEMAVFEREVRSATVRTVGEAQILKIDRKTLLRRIREDPLLAVKLMEKLSHRIRELNAAYAKARQAGS